MSIKLLFTILLLTTLCAGCVPNQPRELRGTKAYYSMRATQFSNRYFFHDLYSIHDGTLYGGPDPILGPVGSALLFNGANEYAAIPSTEVTNMGRGDFSITAWIQVKQETAYQIFIDKRDSRAVGYEMLLYHGRLLLQIGDAQGYSNFYDPTGPNLADGEWHFVTATVARQDKQGLRLYADAQLLGVYDPTAHTGSLDNNVELWIGRHHSNDYFEGDLWFDGALDDIKLFGRVLLVEEIEGQFQIRAFSV